MDFVRRENSRPPQRRGYYGTLLHRLPFLTSPVGFSVVVTIVVVVIVSSISAIMSPSCRLRSDLDLGAPWVVTGSVTCPWRDVESIPYSPDRARDSVSLQTSVKTHSVGARSRSLWVTHLWSLQVFGDTVTCPVKGWGLSCESRPLPDRVVAGHDPVSSHLQA